MVYCKYFRMENMGSGDFRMDKYGSRDLYDHTTLKRGTLSGILNVLISSN